MLKSLFVIVFVVSVKITIAQLPTTFGPGEKLTYKASYTMKGMLTDVAGIDLEVVDVPGKAKPVYRLVFTANTFTSWDSYLKVRHAYQTFVEAENIKPMLMKQDSDVKGNITKAKYTFKQKNGIAEMEVTKSGEPAKNRNIKITGNTYDIVSLIYFARNQKWATLKVGHQIPVSVLFLERILNIKLKYIGKETVNVPKMGNKECYKVALILEQKFIVEPNVNFIWITADKNQIPVQITTVYKEGKAVVKLTDFANLKNK